MNNFVKGFKLVAVKVITFDRAYGMTVLAIDLKPLLVSSKSSETSVFVPVLVCLVAL